MIVKAGQRAYLTVHLYDRKGQLDAPLSLHYHVLCLTTGVAVRGWTQHPPASVVELELLAQDTRMVGGNEREDRLVTVVANYGDDNQVVDEYSFTVQRLRNPPPAVMP